MQFPPLGASSPPRQPPSTACPAGALPGLAHSPRRVHPQLFEGQLQALLLLLLGCHGGAGPCAGSYNTQRGGGSVRRHRAPTGSHRGLRLRNPPGRGGRVKAPPVPPPPAPGRPPVPTPSRGAPPGSVRRPRSRSRSGRSARAALREAPPAPPSRLAAGAAPGPEHNRNWRQRRGAQRACGLRGFFLFF